jgi:hypothetical protein
MFDGSVHLKPSVKVLDQSSLPRCLTDGDQQCLQLDAAERQLQLPLRDISLWSEISLLPFYTAVSKKRSTTRSSCHRTLLRLVLTCGTGVWLIQAAVSRS